MVQVSIDSNNKILESRGWVNSQNYKATTHFSIYAFTCIQFQLRWADRDM